MLRRLLSVGYLGKCGEKMIIIKQTGILFGYRQPMTGDRLMLFPAQFWQYRTIL
jgi:hypothetical protein